MPADRVGDDLSCTIRKTQIFERYPENSLLGVFQKVADLVDQRRLVARPKQTGKLRRRAGIFDPAEQRRAFAFVSLVIKPPTRIIRRVRRAAGRIYAFFLDLPDQEIDVELGGYPFKYMR